MKETNQTILSTHARSLIDRWLLRYPADKKRSGIMQALTIVQEENGGWLSKELINAVADYLEVPRIAAYEVVSFYSMYNQEPTGRHVINVCTNISCMLNGSQEIVDHIKKRLEINVNETTPDGKFTLRTAECLAACAGAPMFYIGKKYYENLTPEKVDDILKELE